MESDKKLIILVDDNLANLKIGNNLLEEKYTVATAPSAAKMFSLLKNNSPAIILLDIDMPEMNGRPVGGKNVQPFKKQLPRDNSSGY